MECNFFDFMHCRTLFWTETPACSNTNCTEGARISNRVQAFTAYNDIEMAEINGRPISEAFSAWFGSVDFESHCESCRTPRVNIRFFQFEEMPEVIILSIPRVTFNRVTKRQEKDHTAVDIRGNLTITWNGYRQNYRLVGITDLK